jgi:hypothetical protein
MPYSASNAISNECHNLYTLIFESLQVTAIMNRKIQSYVWQIYHRQNNYTCVNILKKFLTKDYHGNENNVDDGASSDNDENNNKASKLRGFSPRANYTNRRLSAKLVAFCG